MRMPRILATFVAVAALVVGVAVPAASASAATTAPTGVVQAREVKTTLAGFSAGNIISDAVFTNKNTMTEAQIQTFFNGKVSKCQTGYVCLKDFRITSVTRPADAYCKGYTGAANESAARIIYRVAQACNINPQVLIVMLQKEQGLINHTWPSAWRYNIALGQGCPDTAPCDPNFIGFFHQIYGAARQMQIYMEGKWFQWYAPGNTWNVLYNPNAACGSGRVYIANKATAALYYYTPYQPNAAALRAGYGLGNSCSAYGNRNFYNYFTDWFGSTQGKPAVAPPVLSSVNTTNYVLTVDAAGTAWGYPYTKNVWGAKVQLGSGLAGATDLIDIGDFDGDGNRDFLAFGASRGVTLFRSEGVKSLGEPVAAPGDWTGTTAIIAAGDFNGDGIVDVFTTNAGGELFLRAGTGFGAFRTPIKVGSGWQNMSHVFGGVDLNGDGKSDLVARDRAGNLNLYPGDGRGGWKTKIKMGHGWSAMTSIFSPGDFDGDRKTDILAHGADGRLMLYRGLGTGKVTSGGAVGTGWSAMVLKGGAGAGISGARAFPAGFGDVDGVRGNDVVALSTMGEAYIYGGNGLGGWGARSTLGTGWNPKDRIISLGDFNRDGYSDLGRIGADGTFYLHAGKAGGGFSPPVQIGHGWGAFTQIVGGFDYDGDRMTDVAVVTADGFMLLYRGNGRGGWSAGGGSQISHGWSIADQVFYAGDFDGDRRGELVARLKDGTLRSYPMTGAGGFAAATQLGHGWNGFSTVFSPGDFNGDGRSDIIAIAADGVMYLYPGSGTGKMQARTKIGSGWNVISMVR